MTFPVQHGASAKDPFFSWIQLISGVLVIFITFASWVVGNVGQSLSGGLGVGVYAAFSGTSRLLSQHSLRVRKIHRIASCFFLAWAMFARVRKLA